MFTFGNRNRLSGNAAVLKTGLSVLFLTLLIGGALVLGGCPMPEPAPVPVPDPVPGGGAGMSNLPGDESDPQGHIVIDNRIGESMYLYAGSTLLKTIGAESAIAVEVEHEGKAVTLNMWRTADVPDTADPDSDLLFRSWTPVLPSEARETDACLAHCPLWVIESGTERGAGTVVVNYTATTSAGTANNYNVDIHLNGQNNSNLLSISPGTEDRIFSLPYGTHTLYYRYWYDNQADNKPQEEVGWLQASSFTLNANFPERELEIPLYTGSTIGSTGIIHIKNNTEHNEISIKADSDLIENIVIFSGDRTGLSNIPQGLISKYVLPEKEQWYSFSASLLTGGTALYQHLAYITPLHEYEWHVNDSIHTLRVQNAGTETVLLHNAAADGYIGRYLGVLLKPKEERTVEVAGNVTEFHVHDSTGTFLSATPFTLTDYSESAPLFLLAPPILSAGGAPLTNGGTYQVNTQLSITSADMSADIYYTTDGSEPTASVDLRYTVPVNLGSSPGSVTINAIAVKNGMVSDGVTAVVNLQLRPAAPSFSVNGSTHINGKYYLPNTQLSMASVDSSADIYYTLNGSDPTTSAGTEYTGRPVNLGSSPGSVTIKAAAKKNGIFSPVATAVVNLQNAPAPPSFSVNGEPVNNGEYYAVNTKVRMTAPDSTAAIYYTLNGSDPTTSAGSRYTGLVNLGNTSGSVTIKTAAVKNGIFSTVVTVAVTLQRHSSLSLFVNNEALANGGYYLPGAQLRIISTDTSADIYYTLNGSDPTTSAGTLYTAPVNIGNSPGSVTIKAATKKNGIFSPVATAVVNLQNAPDSPSFSVNGEPINNGGYYAVNTKVRMTAPDSTATIYYTLNGSDPTTSAGSRYTNPVNLGSVPKSVSIKAATQKNGIYSSVVTVAVNLQNPPARPSFSVNGATLTSGGYYLPGAQLRITSADASASIYYTLNGYDPATSAGTLYTSPVNIGNTPRSVTIKAIAVKNGIYSPVAMAAVNLQNAPDPPTFSINDTTINNGVVYAINTKIRMTAPNSSAIYYTLNGSDPVTAGSWYTGLVNLGSTPGTVTIKAAAVKNGIFSTVVTVTVTIKPDPPELHINGDSISNNTTITRLTFSQLSLSAPDSSTTIYYTMDGSTPTTADSSYSGAPISLGTTPRTVTVKAAAERNGIFSDVVTATVIVQLRTLELPEFEILRGGTARAYDDSMRVSVLSTDYLRITDTTHSSDIFPAGTSSTVYYDTGSPATTNSVSYTVPVSFSELGIGLVSIEAIAAKTGYRNSEPAQLDVHIIPKLLASDGAAGDEFGVGVALDGNTIIIGAQLDDDNGANSGSAYIFTKGDSGWTQQAKLLASDGTANDYFGYSVAIDGDTAIIGAFGDTIASGSAYIFTRSGTNWTQQAKLTASDGAADDYFGYSVALDGNTAIISAFGDNNNGYESGSAYIFTRSGSSWTQQDKLTASDGAAGDRFGYGVALDGNTAIISAYYDDDNGTNSGSAYIFTRSGSNWTQQDKLTASDGTTDDRFGSSVAVDGDTAIVGAYRDDDNGTNSGSVYVFTRSGSSWTQQDKLTASDGTTDDRFGSSVAVDGNAAIIGAYHDDDNGARSGSAYIFTRSGNSWTQQAKLKASNGATLDYFGISVALNGDTAIVGAYRDDDNGTDSGSAYIFTRTGSSWQ